MTRRAAHRRGTALVIAAVVLALLGVVTLGVAGATGDDAALATQRLSAVRAAAAAESARAICLRQLKLDPAAPATGEFALPDGSVAVVVQPFGAFPDPPGEAIVEGRSEGAVRRITVAAPD